MDSINHYSDKTEWRCEKCGGWVLGPNAKYSADIMCRCGGEHYGNPEQQPLDTDLDIERKTIQYVEEQIQSLIEAVERYDLDDKEFKENLIKDLKALKGK